MKKKLTLALITFTPALAFAQARDFKGLVQIIVDLIKSLIPLIVALTLLVFMWGIFQLVRSNSEDSRKEAIAVITYGIISLFVMVSVWGLVSILTSTFFGGALIIPQLR
jgi:ABC-type nickel/cobalt efflux system permease component RcnA